MQKSNQAESTLVEQYLHVICYNKISENIFRDMLDYESKADPIEKKLIKRIKHQIEEGKVILAVPKVKRL